MTYPGSDIAPDVRSRMYGPSIGAGIPIVDAVAKRRLNKAEIHPHGLPSIRNTA
jgi:hypothetical protein